MLAPGTGASAPFWHGVLDSLLHLPENCGDITSLEKETLFRKTMSNPMLHRLLAIHKKLSDMVSNPCQPSSFCAYDLAGNIYELYRCHTVITAASEELLVLLSTPCIRALFDAHDKIAGKEFLPVLPEISDQVDEDEQAVKIVRIEKRREPLGATLRVGDSGLAYVARVLEGGPAERSGIIHTHDEVHEVNGRRVHGLSVDEVAQLMSVSERSIVLKLMPAQVTFDMDRNQFSIRANFTYDPAHDASLPCREAGMYFRRGDIMHIVSAHDINWWQAYREGDDMQQYAPRARLIPSLALQERRQATMQRLSTGSVSIPGSPTEASRYPKRATMPLLAGSLLSPRLYRKLLRTKKPIYDTWTPEGLVESSSYGELYVNDYIAPYDEVRLYMPVPTRRRPLILIGPAGIIKHELRLKLLCDKRFSSPVPYTTRPKRLFESEGKDYHFVSRSQMEADIEQERFVEYGEYKGHLYGTHLQSIINIIGTGRICLMAPQPQSIKLLRRKEIKPYIVYVEPPSLGALKSGGYFDRGAEGQDAVQPADIILRTARIDALYGHYFDYTLAVSSFSAAYKELLSVVKRLDFEPQWVPSEWIEE